MHKFDSNLYTNVLFVILRLLKHKGFEEIIYLCPESVFEVLLWNVNVDVMSNGWMENWGYR